MIIGFAGYSKVGKDTAFDALPSTFTRVAFADPLKRELADTLMITIDELQAKKEEYRHLMVSLGRSRRLEDPDYWIKAVQPLPAEDIAFTDVRYANEADWIMRQGGYVAHE